MNTILSTTFVLAESEAGMTRLFDLDWLLLHDAFLMIIAIFALFLFLSHFLFNPVRKFLSDRQSRIADDIETAQTEKADAIALKEDYENRIRDIDKQADEILSAARQKALANEADIVAKAKEEEEAAKKDLHAAKMAAKKAAVKSVKSKKAGKAIVTVKKVAGAEGYQVQYSLKKSMKSAKNVKIKKNSITIKRLKKGKTYYVRVRAFSKDSKGKQICTAWSTAKKVTIKK